jgi:oligoendopeptidase F
MIPHGAVRLHFMKISIALLFFPLLCPIGVAQETFEPLPGDRRIYTIDFARNFYESPSLEAAERRAIQDALRTLGSRRGHLADSPDHLAASLRQYEELLVRSERYGAYLHLRYATDTTNAVARDAETALDAEVAACDEAVKDEFARLSPARLDRYTLARPSLRPYVAFLRGVRQARRPRPSSDRGDVATVEPLAVAWQAELHELLLKGVPPARSDSADAAERKGAFVRHYEALRSKRDAMAFALIHLAAARNTMARLRGFDGAADEAYAGSGWTRGQVRALLERIGERGDVYKRYQRLRARTASAADIWDLNVTRPGAPRPRFTIDQTRTLLLDVLRPLGPLFGGELARLLDPGERRLDIAPGPNRLRGGFSKGFPGMTSVFFANGFRGEYNDLRVLTHEATHAIHRQLENGNRVRPVYASGPKYLFEATAIFNELLLPDTLARRAADPALRRFYLEQWLDGKGTIVFAVAAEAELEDQLYEGVAKGTIRNADDLDALTRKVFGRTSIWPERHPELAARWMEIPLLYEDPFYDMNYVWAGMVALNLLAAYERDPDRFVPRYIAMMRNGFDRPAADLLRDFVGIDIQDPSLLESAVAIAEQRMTALE